MTLIEQLINEEIDLLIEASRDRGKRYPVRNGNLNKAVNKMQYDKNKGEMSSKGKGNGGGRDRGKGKSGYQPTQSNKGANRNNGQSSNNTPQTNNQATDNNNNNTSQEQQTNQPQPQEQQPQQQQNNLPPKPKEEGGAMCDSKDMIGNCINKIKKKISELYVGWPQSLFSMNESHRINEDDESNDDSKDSDNTKKKELLDQVNELLTDFDKEYKKTTTRTGIRKMFVKLFELWTLVGADKAKDYKKKYNALKKNLKNYRNIFTTYRSKFSDAFKTLDINKSHLSREYKIMEEEIDFWQEKIYDYSPGIRELLKDHISNLENVMSTYKSRMFWYFKAPKIVRKKTATEKQKSKAKWDRRTAAFKRFRQRGRQALKNYVNKGPKAGSSNS